MPILPQLLQGISIHAPRTGSDRAVFRRAGTREDFNPRSPHGERLGLYQRGIRRVYFNPRSPHGERRYHSSFDYPVWIISIHAPRTGSDIVFRAIGTNVPTFQSTLPARGATRR